MLDRLTAAQWEQFDRDGWTRLGRQLSPSGLQRLQQSADDIMLGKAVAAQTPGALAMFLPDGSPAGCWPAPRTLGYKEIYGLEYEPSFLQYMQQPLFRHVGERVYGAGKPIGISRAMFFAKPPGVGTPVRLASVPPFIPLH
eukprot:SAG22_NODE_11_length_35583_cov_107.128790_2_plen_141_part_00